MARWDIRSGFISLSLCALASGQCAPGWEPGLPNGSLGGPVSGLLSFDFDGAGPQPSQLVAGGSFSVGGYGNHLVAKFDGQYWRPVKFSPTLTAGGVYAMVVHNGQLTVAGNFNSMHGTPALSVATWNGTDWQAMGAGFNGSVNAMAVYNGELYAGGAFTQSGSTPTLRLAKWNGTAWVAVGGGMTSAFTPAVYALAAINNRLYVGGYFQQAGGVAATNLAAWNGSTWSAVGNPSHPVRTLATYSNATVGSARLFIGGDFFTINGQSATSTAVLRFDPVNGDSWSTYGAPGGLRCEQLHVVPVGLTSFQVNGVFSGSSGISQIHRVVNNVWTQLPQPSSFGRRLATRLNTLHVGTSGGDGKSSVQSFDGTTWTPISTDANPGPISDMVNMPGGDIVALAPPVLNLSAFVTQIRRRNLATGEWTTIVNDPFADFVDLMPLTATTFAVVDNIRRQVRIWNGSNFSDLGNLSDALIHAVARAPNGDIIAGGIFGAASGVPVQNVARWIGNVWTPMGGLDSLVSDILVTRNGTIYACGSFSNASGLPASRIARWNGVIWEGLGSGLDGSCTRMTELADGSIVVTGGFTTAGGVPARGLARWNGTTWSALGSNMPTSGWTIDSLLALPSGGLIVGGNFTSIGGVTTNHVARWDGSNWHTLAQGIELGQASTKVTSLAMDGPSAVAVGGWFSGPVGVDSANFAVFNLAQSGCCDSIDFNRNTVFPEDQDVIDFFNVLAGADCPYTPPAGQVCDIDFNNNTVFPEDQDVIDFFTVLAGGECS
ncbi:MAG TPA: hypothetical protein VK157_13430 [Phycisphaerales bacterium]|nr:hypothetical protein [Phycisphaerales bacterium]